MTEWQQITWKFFHIISLNYDNRYKNEYNTFFDTFKTIIPCKICRNHYIHNISNDKMNIKNNVNSDRIFNWTIDIHNMVNNMNKKKIWSYNDSNKYYKSLKLNNELIRQFIFEYIKTNYRKGFNKTTQLIKMINTLPYIYPYNEKREKLIAFKEKFALNRNNIKKWLNVFFIILKS